MQENYAASPNPRIRTARRNAQYISSRERDALCAMLNPGTCTCELLANFWLVVGQGRAGTPDSFHKNAGSTNMRPDQSPLPGGAVNRKGDFMRGQPPKDKALQALTVLLMKSS